MKEKNTSDLPRQRPSSCLFKVLLGIAVVLCACLLMVVFYQSVGFIPTSPDAALQATAESLYAHPQPTLAYVQFNHQTSAMQRKICYWADPQEEDNTKTSPHLSDFLSSLVFINGGRVPLNAVHVEIRMEQERLYLASCVNVAGLSAGLHLVELHLKANPWDTPIISQWAVMVE